MKIKEFNAFYGQVEPNRLSGITFGNIEAQAPAYWYNSEAEGDVKWEPIPYLENGQFLCVVPAPKSLIDFAPMGRIAVYPDEVGGTGEEKVDAAHAVPYLVFSEKKIYDEREGYFGFIDVAEDKTDGVLYPRLIGLTPDSCVFTTNTIGEYGAEGVKRNTLYTGNETIKTGDIYVIGTKGYLIAKTSSVNDDPIYEDDLNKTYEFVVNKVYTMPDAKTLGLKLQCKRFN